MSFDEEDFRIKIPSHIVLDDLDVRDTLTTILNEAGTEEYPAYSFGVDVNTGMYLLNIYHLLYT